MCVVSEKICITIYTLYDYRNKCGFSMVIQCYIYRKLMDQKTFCRMCSNLINS